MLSNVMNQIKVSTTCSIRHHVDFAKNMFFEPMHANCLKFGEMNYSVMNDLKHGRMRRATLHNLNWGQGVR